MKMLFLPLLLASLAGFFSEITLDELRWKNRILLVFPAVDSRPIGQVNKELMADIEERDMVYFIFGDSLISNSSYTFDANYVEQLRERYVRGTQKSCYVLLGKDGGSKLRREQEEINWEELFGTIDAMPMRRREMREDGKGS
ncbi:DUF4174 domain-containing protein [Cyclobacterium xiamenense]|uniref:DUF4174 domain-containing protein n=1 Tax=Cyclobacterium xiamenense TaxID=1297121 RepID=UPI0013872BE0|nr:DUF4174 domain-containing protein [Cyclobacterium xiamenense]